jgi:hypothetical protein
VAFFEQPPPPPRPVERHRQPAWIGPPTNVLGAAVPLELVLARTPDAAVLVRNVVAYPTGVAFVLAVRKRRFDAEGFYDPLGHHPGVRRREGMPDEVLRFGVQLRTDRRRRPWTRPAGRVPTKSQRRRC